MVGIEESWSAEANAQSPDQPLATLRSTLNFSVPLALAKQRDTPCELREEVHQVIDQYQDGPEECQHYRYQDPKDRGDGVQVNALLDCPEDQHTESDERQPGADVVGQDPEQNDSEHSNASDHEDRERAEVPEVPGEAVWVIVDVDRNQGDDGNTDDQADQLAK